MYYYSSTINWSRTHFFIDNNHPEESVEDDNSEEAVTPDEDLSISAVLNAKKTLANHMALNNLSPNINFEKLEKKNKAWFLYKQSSIHNNRFFR